MAGSTRLELATSGVTGRRSNRLNYDPALFYIIPHYFLNTFMISFREHCQLDEVFTKPLPIRVLQGLSTMWRARFTLPAPPEGRTPSRLVSTDTDYEVQFIKRKSDPRLGPDTGLTIPKELKTSDFAWDFTFQSDDENDSFGVTGQGGKKAFVIFATVIHALKEFVRAQGRPFIIFTAKEASRRKLYDRFIRLVAAAVPGMHGFKLDNTESLRGTIGSAGQQSYVIVPRHISLKTVYSLANVWHRKSDAAADEFLSSL